LVRDMKTGLPIKVHPTIKEMFPHRNNPYYFHNNLTKKTGQHGAGLKNPETVWSAAAQNILQDMQSKKSFHIHDWNRPNREFVANLRALPPPPPPPRKFIKKQDGQKSKCSDLDLT